jgi:large subunit ribosomal protein L25
MERVQVKAVPRITASKGHLKQLRATGLVPGVVYGKKSEPATVAVDAKDLSAILSSATGANTLVDLTLDGKLDTVMIKELRRDILLADRLLHVDFVRISLLEKLEVQVPLVFTGEPIGVDEGGILQPLLREIYLKVLPTEIPETLELDISGLAVGQILTAADLEIPANAELITEPTEAVVTVVAPRIVEEDADDAVPGEGVATETTEAETEE